MSLKSLQLVTQISLAFAKVIDFFSQQFSKTHQSYQAKKFLKTSKSDTKTLEYFLSIYQKEGHSSLILTHRDFFSFSFPYSSAIPGELNHVDDREKARGDWEKRTELVLNNKLRCRK